MQMFCQLTDAVDNPCRSFPPLHDRAFADFVFGSLVLHFFVFNFLG